MNRKLAIVGCLLLSLVVISPASALTYRVGTGPGCTHSSIQAAVNAANVNPGRDSIIITRSLSYTAQAVKIQQAQSLTLAGGYATCADSAPSGERTIVSGNGGSADSVFTVESGGAEEILFNNLLIRDGDESIDYYGGGIDFTGSGRLTLSNVTLTQNEAGYGGGLSARGTGPDANVFFMGETIVNNNLATQDGGGIHLRGDITLYASNPKTAIWFNNAAGLANTPPGTYHGYGGGMAVLSPASAYIGSTGYGSLGTINGNSARVGGGIALLADEDGFATAYLFTTDPTTPQRIRDNYATDAGGAFFVDNSVSVHGEMNLWDTTIENNTAPVGSVGYLASTNNLVFDFGALLFMNIDSESPLYQRNRPSQSVPCNPGVACSVAKNNRSIDAGGNPSNGALIYGLNDTGYFIKNYRFTGNSARSLLDLTNAGRGDVVNTLIDNNTFTAAVLQFPEGDPEVILNHLTIADNSIGGPGVIAHRGHVELNRSIIWQPGKLVRDTAASSGTFDGIQVLANESASIPGVSVLFYPFDPGFINPTLKDYHLRAGSEAIDAVPYSAALDGTLDLDRLPRSVDLPLVPAGTSVDLGAYERQSIRNIMVNDSFNSDLSQWALPYPTHVSRNADNGNGPSGSGSLRVDGSISGTAASATFAKQCQVLPGPSTYRLTGSGKSFGNCMLSPCDGLRIHYKVFKPTPPAYGCTGLVISEGDVVIPATNSWRASTSAGQFSIAGNDYVSNAAVEISLVAIDVDVPDLQGFRSFNVAFDGITLEAGNGEIFADGFEQ